MMALLCSVVYVIFTIIVLYHSMKAVIWDIGSACYLVCLLAFGETSWIIEVIAIAIVVMIAVGVHATTLRHQCAQWFFRRLSHQMPSLSLTEKQALNAGDTWFEQSIFRGAPDWKKLATLSTPLTPEEQSFLDHETHELCGLLEEWAIESQHDLPAAAWTYLKEKGFLGLVISKAYGGKGFSARAHSDIVMKIASRSSAAAVTMMVPNSLGPGELLQHYGTSEQKSYYLPRLAKGLEIPCFALTEPEAGSDATSIQSEAIVVKKIVEGQSILGLHLTLDKRWITLAPIATLVGLAVYLRDPDQLLQGVGQEGITCLLIPASTEGLEIGARHLPAHQSFMNGTVRGKDIFVPLSTIIGGQAQAGQGWPMLVECLSVGRAISLPALTTASSGVAYLTTSAFARIRRQFNVEIGQFEGVQEKLAHIGGLQYIINATRLLTLAAVTQDKKPSVASGIAKYFNTELARMAINDAMDVHGGRAVVAGPRNYLFNFYQSIPIAITVEGANIMSRNLLIFGQGSMACHPFVRQEYEALTNQDEAEFEKIFWQHVHYTLQQGAKTIGSAWTGGWLIRVPKRSLRRLYQRVTRLSYAYAFLADVSLIYFGAQLKRKERLSARLADGLSYLYMAMAVLHYAHQEGETPDQQLHARWAVTYCLAEAAASMQALCRQFKWRPLGWVLQRILFPFGQWMHRPTDQQDRALAQGMMKNNAYREQLKTACYLSGDAAQPVDRVEQALQLLIQASEIYVKIPDLKPFKLHAKDFQAKLQAKVAQGILTPAEKATILAVEKARWDAILVDEFKS